MRALSDGNYRFLCDGQGTGFSSLGEVALTSPWPAGASGGSRFFFKGLGRGALWTSFWTAAWQPGRVSMAAEMDALAICREICVVPERNLELHRITVRNLDDRPRSIEITSSVDVALLPPAAHAAHPVFSKLFLETEFVREARCLLVRRRPRSPDERHPWMYHALLGDLFGVESDRARWWGRGARPGTPLALERNTPLSGTVGSVLDPILCLRSRVEVKGHQEAHVSFLIGAAQDRTAALESVQELYRPSRVEHSFALADARGKDALHALDMSDVEADYLQSLGAAIVTGTPELRSLRATWPECDPDLAGKLGLPPGRPWVVFHADGNAPRARMLSASRYWKSLDWPISVIVAGSQPLSARDPKVEGYTFLPELPAATLHALDALAAMVVRDRFPELVEPEPIVVANPEGQKELGEPSAFEHGLSEDGTEYVIRVHSIDERVALPPRPWTNVVANETFGFLMSETGAGATWNGNSREHRLTPWANDPLLDPHGEAFYVRDEETGSFASCFAGPRPGADVYEMRVGWGYSTCRASILALNIETTAFVPRADPLKITWIRITNPGKRSRFISLFSFYRLVIGGGSSELGRWIETAFDVGSNTVLARHAQYRDRLSRVFAAIQSNDPLHSRYTGDGRGFVGSEGDLSEPSSLANRGNLDDRVGAGLDACIAQQAVIEVPAGGSREIAFLFGEAPSREAALSIVKRYRDPDAIPRALADVKAFWRGGVDRVRVQTPMPALDVLVNGWLPYQTLSCRIWARSALYQSGGAFGYRDQLQDAGALVHLWPELTRGQILLHAAHQFEEGDVLHWWHPPDDRGLRTRFADDLLWLPFVTAGYVETTGDRGVLDEHVGFVRARRLEAGEDEAYLATERSNETADVYTHCCRAIDRSLEVGSHGLPLFGTGDWNDGMNRVGREGRGESVWMGFFLYSVLASFTPICEARGDADRVLRYRAHGEALKHAVNEGGWDGGWYRRGYYDDGTPLGSSASDECRIDALAQAWSVLSEAAPPDRGVWAMDAVETQLVSEADGIIRLLTPPFDKTPKDPGYIKGYVPGVRENGGQYTHAALWVVAAMACLRRRHRAVTLFDLLNPMRHTSDAASVLRYGAEPYVVAADVYGEPPHVGRAGWTWYTGSAGWMYRVALESILGVRLHEGKELLLDPCVPDEWPEFTVRLQLPGETTSYVIHASNPKRDATRVVLATVDGVAVAIEGTGTRIPLLHDDKKHRVLLILGKR